jgi:hypothetical protein
MKSFSRLIEKTCSTRCYLETNQIFHVLALIDLCVKEVEARGLGESGIYRIPGNEVDANQLLEKLLLGKGAPPR